MGNQDGEKEECTQIATIRLTNWLRTRSLQVRFLVAQTDLGSKFKGKLESLQHYHSKCGWEVCKHLVANSGGMTTII